MHALNNLHRHKKSTGKEMRFAAQIGEYNMDKVILDLEFDANFLPKKTWELMANSELQWSLIQLKITNQ